MFRRPENERLATRPATFRHPRETMFGNSCLKSTFHRTRRDEFRYDRSMSHLLGYARVSTIEQNVDLQLDALTAAGCYRTFTDKASGKLTSRPQLDLLLDQLRPGDTLVVWRLDRLGRSMQHLIDTVTALKDNGVAFRS